MQPPDSYHHLFDPEKPRAKPKTRSLAGRPNYVYAEPIVFAINVALAVKRPLLLRGRSGSGKSSLAYAVSRVLDYRYEEFVISSRTTAQDLLWSVDMVRRLGDAQAGLVHAEPRAYLQAGVLWQAFAPETIPDFPRDTNAIKTSSPLASVKRAVGTGKKTTVTPKSVKSGIPSKEFAKKEAALAEEWTRPAVVLLDEIDKAEPDLPNDLLAPLGEFAFTVPLCALRVQATADRQPLVIITTNEERDLPLAFLRRCVTLNLDTIELSSERRHKIARSHFEEVAAADGSSSKKLPPDVLMALLLALDNHFDALTAEAMSSHVRAPSIAEYLDAVRACIELEVRSGHGMLRDLALATMKKNTGLDEGNKR